jgi:hypothetical protein
MRSIPDTGISCAVLFVKEKILETCYYKHTADHSHSEVEIADAEMEEVYYFTVVQEGQ